MPTLSHPDLHIQATRTPPPPTKKTHPSSVSSDNNICLWSALWTSTQSSHSHRAWFTTQPQCVAVVKAPPPPSKALPPATVAEPTASGAPHYYMRGGTCDLFNYSALHFYPTIQNATWELIASNIHLYNLPQAHKLSDFGAGRTSRAGTSRSLSEPSRASSLQCVGGRGGGAPLNGAALWLAENGREKKYTCYLVNPQTCKIGISWMSATEMELTRDLFIVTEGH